MAVRETELVYGKAGDLALQGLLYLPDTPPPYSVVVDVHGVAWSGGHLESGRHYDEYLSAASISIRKINRLCRGVVDERCRVKGALWRAKTGAKTGRKRGMVWNPWEYAQYSSKWITSSAVLRTKDESA